MGRSRKTGKKYVANVYRPEVKKQVSKRRTLAFHCCFWHSESCSRAAAAPSGLIICSSRLPPGGLGPSSSLTSPVLPCSTLMSTAVLKPLGNLSFSRMMTWRRRGTAKTTPK